MAKKRKLADAYASADPAPLRALPKSLEPRLDAVSGQRCAIPGLDDSDGDLSDDASREALVYLRSVRSEAQAIPSLLRSSCAQEPPHYSPTSDNAKRGYYVDGAYISVSASAAELNGVIDNDQNHDGQPTMVEPQHAYHAALLSRFIAHRASLLSRGPSTSQASHALDPSTHPTAIERSIGRIHEAARWNRIMQTTPPCTAQVAAMSQDDVLWLLEYIPTIIKHKKMVTDGGRGGRVLGAWLWALLGRLGDLGTLSSEEVSIVRELAKRAGSIIVGRELAREAGQLGAADTSTGDRTTLEDPAAAITPETGADELGDEASIFGDNGSKQPGAIDGDGSGTESYVQRDIDAAKTRLLSAYVSTSTLEIDHASSTVDVEPRDEAETPGRAEEEMLTATLDMILTVVGEFYGQRDLLVVRDRLWECSFGEII